MDTTALEPAEEKALRKERTVLRTLITNFHNMLLCDHIEGIDLQVVKSSRVRLTQIDTRLLGHLLAGETDPTQELSLNSEYAEKAGAILSAHTKAELSTKSATSSKVSETKLPPILPKNPASWIKFRTLLDLTLKNASSDEKKTKLVAALPPNLAMDIRHLSYADAIKQLEIEFESEESLRTTIRQLFQKVPKVKSLNDHSAMKELH